MLLLPGASPNLESQWGEEGGPQPRDCQGRGGRKAQLGGHPCPDVRASWGPFLRRQGAGARLQGSKQAKMPPMIMSSAHHSRHHPASPARASHPSQGSDPRRPSKGPRSALTPLPAWTAAPMLGGGLSGFTNDCLGKMFRFSPPGTSCPSVSLPSFPDVPARARVCVHVCQYVCAHAGIRVCTRMCVHTTVCTHTGSQALGSSGR